ncbi:outer membrane protein assembly factor BamC [Thiofilum flexile]|uniref:outer membrane protein assembly factor BamC n=1 Tax=Thiofilum flexile TaxID=125627 RepID=UPI000375A143|nr:outer membrane protein assembly factor BamC [Thiofilum flexile]
MKLKPPTSIKLGVIAITLSSLLMGCSAFKVDAVDDSVAYRGTKSVKALAIPPGLSTPDFDPTFAVNPQESSGGRQVKLIKLNDGNSAIATNESPLEVWKRLETLLPNLNLRIQSKDVEKATYTVLRNAGDDSIIPRKGWLNRALGLEKESTIHEDDEVYSVKVANKDNVTFVGIFPEKNANAAIAEKLLAQLKLDLEL